jgi:hypothetical protein
VSSTTNTKETPMTITRNHDLTSRKGADAAILFVIADLVRQAEDDGARIGDPGLDRLLELAGGILASGADPALRTAGKHGVQSVF